MGSVVAIRGLSSVANCPGLVSAASGVAGSGLQPVIIIAVKSSAVVIPAGTRVILIRRAHCNAHSPVRRTIDEARDSPSLRLCGVVFALADRPRSRGAGRRLESSILEGMAQVHILGLILASLIGISLGLLGAGGSTLAVPILVYVSGMAAKPAIAASLLVVGSTSLVGSFRHWRRDNVDVRISVVFGIVSMGGAYAGGEIGTLVSGRLQLILFALVMLAAAVSMFRSRGEESLERRTRLVLVLVIAAAVGLVTGLVGIGGGFLIVPALVVFAGLPMKRAVGTSLLVIAMNCASGFAAYAGEVPIDWPYVGGFTAMAIAGVMVGSQLVDHVPQRALKKSFAVFLVLVGVWILGENLGV